MAARPVRVLGVLAAAILAAAPGGFALETAPAAEQPPAPVQEALPEQELSPEQEPLPEQELPSEQEPSSQGNAAPVTYPKEQMFVCRDRLEYKNGALVLRIDRLGLLTAIVGEFDDETVQALTSGAMTAEEQAGFFSTGTGDELLKQGVVLLNNASLPGGNTNSNVSLSGHRDIYGKEFLKLNELTAGDRMYLTYNGTEYEYTYLDTVIHKPDDWSVTYCGDEPLLTLISCDPVGTSRNRIVVRARMTAVRPEETHPEELESAPPAAAPASAALVSGPADAAAPASEAAGAALSPVPRDRTASKTETEERSA